MYSDDAQNNPLLLTSLLVEALANSNNGVANQTLNATEQSPTSLQASTAQFLQANGKRFKKNRVLNSLKRIVHVVWSWLRECSSYQ